MSRVASAVPALALVAVVVLAGCAAGPTSPGPSPSASPTPSPTAVDADNPWGTDTLTVAVVADDPDNADAVREAASWWSDNAERYAGYPMEFVVADETEDPDVVVTFVANVSDCGHADDDVVGCAPLVTDVAPDRPANVTIETGLSTDSTVQVVKHEFGHLLGLTHDDEPQSIMAASTTITTSARPNATERAFPWGDSNFTVYVNASGAEDPATFRDQVGHALEYYADGAPGMPDNLTFTRVANRSEAEIVVVVGDACGGSGSCLATSGVDPDGDGAIEEYRRLTITIQDLDVDAVGWHVGNWLAYGFGAENESDRPPPFRNASYEERRSDWWNDD